MEKWNHTKLHSRSTSSYLLPMNVRGSQSLDISISSSEDANNTNSLTRFLYYVSLYVKHLENSKISISGSYWPLTKNIILRNRNWSKIGHKYQLLSLGAEFLKANSTKIAALFGTWSFCSGASWRSTMCGYAILNRVKTSSDVQN